MEGINCLYRSLLWPKISEGKNVHKANIAGCVNRCTRAKIPLVIRFANVIFISFCLYIIPIQGCSNPLKIISSIAGITRITVIK
jgi:hypothetical protein